MKGIQIIIFCTLPLFANNQNPVKVYAWSQLFKPGIVIQYETTTDNEYLPVKKPASVKQYYIYVAHNLKDPIQYDRVWIKGTWFDVLDASKVKPPVVVETPVKKTLIPAGRHNLYLLQMGDTSRLSNKEIPARYKSLMKNAELVLIYSLKGKTYAAHLKKITELEPLHAY